MDRRSTTEDLHEIYARAELVLDEDTGFTWTCEVSNIHMEHSEPKSSMWGATAEGPVHYDPCREVWIIH